MERQMKTSLNGRNLIIRAEGFRSDAYLCSAGIATIGFGSTRYLDREPVQLGDTISRADAEELLTHYIATQIDPMIPRLIPRPLTQPQWDAFASFLYNFGFEKTRGYTLTNVIKFGPEDGSVEALQAYEAELIKWFPKYRLADKKPSLGLFRRRVAELLTFLHLPSDAAWTIPHLGVDVAEFVANVRGGKKPIPEPKLAPPPEPVILDTPLPPPEPVTVQEAPEAALTKETPMSAPEAKSALASKTIWGAMIMSVGPFAMQFGELLSAAAAEATGIVALFTTFIGGILVVIGRMAATTPLK
jgi:lysozyme